MDRPDPKPGLQLFKHSEELDPGFCVCLTIVKASAWKNTFEEFKIDLIHGYVTKLFYF